jgi:hypothetical protein
MNGVLLSTQRHTLGHHLYHVQGGRQSSVRNFDDKWDKKLMQQIAAAIQAKL